MPGLVDSSAYPRKHNFIFPVMTEMRCACGGHPDVCGCYSPFAPCDCGCGKSWQDCPQRKLDDKPRGGFEFL